jgi:hypothetical protein
MRFNTKLQIKLLLWCDRHCCFCKKACGVNIEVHHIIPPENGGSNEEDNAIPLCFDCHSHVGHYNNQAPRGLKIKPGELKARRKQVYEEFTRHLVPPIHYQVTQDLGDGNKRTFPDVGFYVSHLGDSLPVRFKVRVEPFLGTKRLDIPSPYYSGRRPWHLNPRFGACGHFQLPLKEVKEGQRLECKVSATVVDQYDREHVLLPIGYVYDPGNNSWYLEP